MTASRLRVAVDVRCMASGELRGFARYTAELFRELLKLDHLDVVAVSDAPMEMPAGTPDLFVHSPAPDREWRREQVGLPSLLRQLDTDVFFAPANRGTPLLGPPSVLTLHDAVEWDRSLVERPTGRNLVRFGYSNVASLLGATRIITVSHHAASELQKVLGISGDRVSVITEAPGESFNQLPDAVDRAALRRNLDLAGPYVLYLGGFDAKKSVETLVAAWARLDPTATPMLVLGGKIGDGAERFAAIVRDVGGEPSRLRCLGYVDDALLPALYAEAELFVFPAVAEGFGLPPVEAMAMGTASVVANAGSLPESTRGAALRFEAFDVSALSAIMQRLLADDTERARVGHIGRQAVMARTWSDVAAETAEVLAAAAASSTPERIRRGLASLPSSHRWVR